MAVKQINYSLLDESDIDEVNDFYNRTYGSSRTREMFLWEFYNAPAGKAVYIIARDAENNLLVGTQCAIPIWLTDAEGRKILSGKSEDTLVHPGYRGMKIFDRMYEMLFSECKKAGIFYIWGFTSAIKPFSKVGFEAPFAHSQFLISYKAFSAARYLIALNPKNTAASKLKIHLLTIFASFKRAFTAAVSLPAGFSCVTANASQRVSLAGLQKEAFRSNENGFYIYEDEAYLDWRLKNNPYSAGIRHCLFYKEDKIAASIIYNYHKDNTWYLVQALWSDALDEPVRKAMLARSLAELKKHAPVAMVRGWNFSNNKIAISEKETIERTGGVHLERGIALVWIDLTGEKRRNPSSFMLSRMATQGLM